LSTGALSTGGTLSAWPHARRTIGTAHSYANCSGSCVDRVGSKAARTRNTRRMHRTKIHNDRDVKKTAAQLMPHLGPALS